MVRWLAVVVFLVVVFFFFVTKVWKHKKKKRKAQGKVTGAQRAFLFYLHVKLTTEQNEQRIASWNSDDVLDTTGAQSSGFPTIGAVPSATSDHFCLCAEAL